MAINLANRLFISHFFFIISNILQNYTNSAHIIYDLIEKKNLLILPPTNIYLINAIRLLLIFMHLNILNLVIDNTWLISRISKTRLLILLKQI